MAEFTRFKTLGTFLKKRRCALNLTQLEVSLKLGYTNAQFLSNCERGLCAPPLKTIRELVTIYKVPVKTMINLLMDEQRKLLQSELTRSPRLRARSSR
jgi:transcriptional regulator with XRE-family HTH domain